MLALGKKKAAPQVDKEEKEVAPQVDKEAAPHVDQEVVPQEATPQVVISPDVSQDLIKRITF